MFGTLRFGTASGLIPIYYVVRDQYRYAVPARDKK